MTHSRTQSQLPRALLGAFHDPDSPTGRAAREMMARLLADAANREGTREALFAGLSDGVPDIRGTCALLLLQSGEPAQPRLLRALVGAFAHADSETGHAASELMTRLLTDETSRDWAREALVAGLDDDVASVRTTCHQLLQMLR